MMTLPKTLTQFNQLHDAEEYFEFFGLSYDPQLVNINRLHILRKFSQLMATVDDSLSDGEKLEAYREALQSAYTVFLTSSSVEEKLFKVFQKKPGNVVMMSDIEME
ncbi:MAG: nitrogenase-stabilizing/protective protein NifW [Prochlorotrichaceae cyanobacterium]